ncbi:hypothetical protein ACGFY7_23545 [Streptomyces prunicolor]|uniref:hypothetical protein n=1 Tax=Streptomyces prunicolor TaxID=67348 RepID=UPI00371879B5
MPAEIALPVFMRIGSGDEFHLGEITVDVDVTEATLTYGRPELATFLRAAADAIENPSEEVDDAAPR